MAMNDVYASVEPSRAAIDSLDGPTLIEFGTPWCGYCRAAQPRLAAALADHPHVRHIKIADGAAGRSVVPFKVRLWPTLIFLRRQGFARLIGPAAPARSVKLWSRSTLDSAVRSVAVTVTGEASAHHDRRWWASTAARRAKNATSAIRGTALAA
jgi:thioredoxin 1